MFKDFPLPNHAEAFKAAEAAHCAGEQRKYWEMHDAMFANQRELQVPALKKAARALGLDGAKFDQCLDSGRHTANVRADYELGEKHGRQLDADDLRQRPSVDWRAAVRSVQADHR